VPGDADLLGTARIGDQQVPVGVLALGDDEVAVVRLLAEQPAVVHVQDHHRPVRGGLQPLLVHGARGPGVRLADAGLQVPEIRPDVVDGLLGGIVPRGQSAACPHLHDRAGIAAHRGALLARDVVLDLPAGGDHGDDGRGGTAVLRIPRPGAIWSTTTRSSEAWAWEAANRPAAAVRPTTPRPRNAVGRLSVVCSGLVNPGYLRGVWGTWTGEPREPVARHAPAPRGATGAPSGGSTLGQNGPARQAVRDPPLVRRGAHRGRRRPGACCAPGQGPAGGDRRGTTRWWGGSSNT